MKCDGEEDKDAFAIPIMSANRNYLMNQELYAYQSEKPIDINSLKKGVLLVPKRYENSRAVENYINIYKPSQIIYTKDIPNDLKPLVIYDITNYNTYFHNPIIYVADEKDINTIQWIEGSIYINTDDLSKLEKRLTEVGFIDNIILKTVKPGIELEYNRQFVTFSSMLFLMISYLSVYLIFVFQSVFVYLDVYSRKLSVQYLQGYSYWKRFYEIYMINACAYIVAGIGAYISFDVSIFAIVAYILFFSAIEIVFEVYQIHRFEHKGIIHSLK